MTWGDLSYIAQRAALRLYRRSRPMLNHIGGIGCVALLAVTSAVLSCAVGAQEVPEKLRPPANEQLLFRLHAKGDQVYSCKGEAGQVAWTLKAPDAQLFDQDANLSGSISLDHRGN